MIHHLDKVPLFNAPFSPDYGILTFIRKGWVKGRYNKRDILVHAGDVCIVPQYSTITLADYSNGLELTVILFMKSKTSETIKNERPLKYVIELSHNPVVTPTPDVWPLVLEGITMLDNISMNKSLPNRLELMHHVFNMLFDMVCKPKLHKERTNIVRSRAEHLFEAFTKEVSENIGHSHEVNYYAQKLCVTPNYLLKVCRQVAKTSASDTIDILILKQAQYLLLDQRVLTIQEISRQLGFANQSFFSRFFKRKVGMTPREFRQQGR